MSPNSIKKKYKKMPANILQTLLNSATRTDQFLFSSEKDMW